MFRSCIDEHLDLRLHEERHVQAIFDLVVANRQHLRRFMTWADNVQKVDDTSAFVRRSLEQFARGEGFQCGIWHDDQLVGGIGTVYLRPLPAKTEIGYWLAEHAQGKGIMTRAARATIDYCFGELKLNRVEIQCAAENRRSRAIPERLGFKQEGVLREAGKLESGFVDHVVYAMLAREWSK